MYQTKGNVCAKCCLCRDKLHVAGCSGALQKLRSKVGCSGLTGGKREFSLHLELEQIWDYSNVCGPEKADS